MYDKNIEPGSSEWSMGEAELGYENLPVEVRRDQERIVSKDKEHFWFTFDPAESDEDLDAIKKYYGYDECDMAVTSFKCGPEEENVHLISYDPSTVELREIADEEVVSDLEYKEFTLLGRTYPDGLAVMIGPKE